MKGETSEVTNALSSIESALARGDNLLAYDHAEAAILAGEKSERLFYLKVLALARMGDTEQAIADFAEYRLDTHEDEDSAALRGRILKDLALAAPYPDNRELLGQASEAYRAVHERFGGYFSGINAASLALLAGRSAQAQALASRILGDPAVADPAGYFAAATAAEALLLTGRHAEAAAALERAIAFPDAELSARASTARQFTALAQVIDDEVITRLVDRLRPPPVLFYSGHMFAAGSPLEPEIAGRIAERLEALGVAIGHGALASGADILFAEALLARGAELNIVLPFAREEFVARSVAPGGESWVRRFEDVIARASSVTFSTNSTLVDDPSLYRYGAEYAMGLACLRAGYLGTRPVQVTVWDGAPARGPGGTGDAVATWERAGYDYHVIELGPIERVTSRAAPPRKEIIDNREICSIIFTDYSGFSKLEEPALPLFWNKVMGRVGDVLDAHAGSIRFRNTWGDALYAVIDSASVAAEIARAIQERLEEVDPRELGLDPKSGMRIGLHHGPLYSGKDPVTGRTAYFGAEVTRAARIEPITPIGDVYATQPFAAMLALASGAGFTTRYVGHVPLAKAYGTMPMHRLVREGRGAPPLGQTRALDRP